MFVSSRLATLFIAAISIHVATADYVPGKAFDRFITIWLENQVRHSVLYPQFKLTGDPGFHQS